ncbi:MAG TPA: RICIN domain-containing protein [Lachnospiraceae bacterium]|nr:RICIN domain-containing protein [Lachnospiraceae bacterium]
MTCCQQRNQDFTGSPASGTVCFRSECNNLYMDVNNAAVKEGNNVQVWRGNGTIAQKWTLM